LAGGFVDHAANLLRAAVFQCVGPGVEEAFYESPVLRRFTGVNLGRAAAPDETTVCRFRHLLEVYELGGAMLDRVNQHPAAQGMKIATGTIVDATIIAAPCSTKNAKGGAILPCTIPARATSGTSA
jgi:IS5 family transposase